MRSFTTAPPSSAGRRLALSVGLGLMLAACVPWGMPSGSEGMPHGNMPMGDMHGREGAEEQAPPPVETAPAVEVRASEMAFTPAELTLTTGEPVNITVVNDGRLFHDFTLEAAGVRLNLDPGEQATAAVLLSAPGTFEAICTVPGHAAAGMVLTIEVR